MKLRTLCVSLFLFLLAWVPRASDLDVFLTPDERRWVERSIRFLLALLDGNLAGTAQTGHPGVTTMWTAAVALTTKYAKEAWLQGIPINAIAWREFLQRVPVRPRLSLDVLTAVRWPTVVLASLAVVGTYLLLKKLFDGKSAFLGAALVALDPFYLAYSRLIHHDALAATFMILSLLSLMVYLDRERSAGYLLLSGLMAGLAFLSKASSLFLIPFMVWPILLSDWPWGPVAGETMQRRGALLHGMKTYLAWCALSLLTAIVFWPAMWVDPMHSISMVLDQVTGKVQGVGGSEGSFVTGISLLDAQLLTYPITLLFRVTPLALVGAAAAVWFLGQGYRFSSQAKGIQTRSIIALLSYILGFIVFMSLASVKSGRYILPVSPSVQIVAAVGLCRLGETAAKAIRAPLTQMHSLTLGAVSLGLPILLQAGLCLPHHPYYLTYYSPLLGGAVVATRLMPFGWGEGLDQAAHYLNQKENAASLQVAMWDSDVRFASFFQGETRRLDEECNGNSLPWEDADYVVFYSDSQGTGVPFGLSTARYFHSLEPEHVVRMKGIDYAWIYAAPGPEIPNAFVPAQYDRRVRFGSTSLLLGYDLGENRLEAGKEIKVTLYWQCQKPSQANLKPILALVDEAGNMWSRWQEMEVGGWESPWTRGLVIQDKLKLKVDPTTPAGTCRLLLSLYDEKGKRLPTPEGEEVPLSLLVVTGEGPLSVEELEIAYPQRADLGSAVRFLGYNLSGTHFQPGDTLHLVLFWQALADIDQDYTVFTHLVDHDGVIWGQKDAWPVDGFYPTSQWARGAVTEDPYEIKISPQAPSGDYRLEVGMYLLETGERLPAADEAGAPLGNRILLSSTVQVVRGEY